jgi:tripartite-type tricarboxylate transporter receptor subunit TctC
MNAKWIVAALAGGAFAASGAMAQDLASFYKDKKVSIVIGSAPGGGYDAYGRLVARHLGDHIPGKPTIIAQNMPGAGQTKAAGYINSVAPKDGTAIAAISPGAMLAPALGGPKISYDPAKLQVIGSANSDVYTCVSRPDAAVKTFKDAFDKEIIIGMSSGTTRDMPTLLKNILGVKFKMVSGYPGTKDLTLAFERNEVQGFCGYGYASLMSRNARWIKEGVAKILVQESSRGHADLNKAGVPLATSFAKNAEDRRILDLVYSQGLFGRPYVAAPEVPKDRVAGLRKAFMATLADPKLLAEAKKAKLDIDPMSGEEVQDLVGKVLTTPPAVLKRARQALGTDGPKKKKK